jgi:ribosome-binding protein aMBF1 (putative translation factor)
MSERTKKHLTNEYIKIVIHDASKQVFILTRSEALQILSMLSAHQAQEEAEESIPADEVFADLDKKYGKIGVTIRGCRSRDGLTQAELAKKLGIPQRHVSEMEHSKRPIGKKMAQKLAAIFNTNYRLFL